MKTITAILLIIFSEIASGQEGWGILTIGKTWKSEWFVDSVAFEGNGLVLDSLTHIEPTSGLRNGAVFEHKWLERFDKRSGFDQLYWCMEEHDDRGCPKDWLKLWRICEVCFRKEHVHENRVMLPPPISEWDRAVMKVDSLMKVRSLKPSKESH